jgi:hypothetical protein
MKISNEKLRSILRKSITECGESMPHDDDHHAEHDPLEAIVDMLSKSDEPLSADLGGKASMARGHLYHMSKRAQSLYDRLSDNDELPEWVQSKLAVAESMINAVYDHLDYKLYNQKDFENTGSLGEVKHIIQTILAEEEASAEKAFDPASVNLPIPATLKKMLAPDASPMRFAKLDSEVDKGNNIKHQAFALGAFLVDYADNDPDRSEALFKKLRAMLPRIIKAVEKPKASGKPKAVEKPKAGKEFKSF